MKKTISTLAALLALATLPAQEQTGVCGMTPDDRNQIEQRLLNHLAQPVAQERSGVVQYVPIHFHLVANTAGAGRHKEWRVLDQLCEMNEFYSLQDIRFYLSPHPTHGLFDKSINNDNVYENQTNTFVMENRRHDNALNVFVVQEAVSGNPPIDGAITLAYYNIPRDWIVSRKDQINSNGNGTLSHEVGHFFSLLHPFNGWDFEVFDNSYPGFPNAPSVSPLGVPTELMNGSNCNTAGDYICDTPPDYNFLEPDCVYNGGAKDPNGVLVDPMENNIMSYFSNCNYAFTNEQGDIIHTDLNSNNRNYLDNTFEPVATEITTPADLLIAPIGAQTVDFYNNVSFEWLAVEGATHYLFEIDVVSSFSTINSQAFVLTGTTHTLTNLQPNRTYFWRVRPFNYYYTCNGPVQNSFKTSSTSGIDNIEGLNGWTVSPNPLGSDNVVHIGIDAASGFDARLSVVDATGRTVFTRSEASFPAGSSSFDIALDQLSNGLYFIVLENAQGRATRKLSVVR